jgi:hypothetical protein
VFKCVNRDTCPRPTTGGWASRPLPAVAASRQTRWLADPFAHGSYSFLAPGASVRAWNPFVRVAAALRQRH